MFLVITIITIITWLVDSNKNIIVPGIWNTMDYNRFICQIGERIHLVSCLMKYLVCCLLLLASYRYSEVGKKLCIENEERKKSQRERKIWINNGQLCLQMTPREVAKIWLC